MRLILSLGILPALLLLTGCSSQKIEYTVQVVNLTGETLSVGLVHRVAPGEPASPNWAGPEHVAMGAPELLEKHWGTVVEPHSMKVLGPTEADFTDNAYLRVYGADVSNRQLLGYSSDNPGRKDVLIVPGRLSVEIYVGEDGSLEGRFADWKTATTLPATQHP